MPSTGSVIGAAANYGVLALQNTTTIDTNAAIDGSVGVAAGSTFAASGKAPIITQNVYESANGQFTGNAQVGGTVIIDPARMTQANTDARSGSVTAASQIATQTFWSITVPTTITGNGGLNVINISGSISSSLTLVGSASDVFIVNVSGNLSLKSRESLGIIGVTADHVLYNFTGAGSVSLSSRGTVYGTLLAPSSIVKIDGVLNGAVIAGGSLTLQNGAVIHEIDFTGALPTAATASISGKVYDIDQPGVGIEFATVDLLDGLGNVVKTFTTDASGNYTLSAVPSGTYNLRVTTVDENTQTYFSNTIGTVDGNPVGDSLSAREFTNITLGDGDVGIGYNFAIQIVNNPPS